MGVFYLAVVAFVAMLVLFVGELLLAPFTAWIQPAALGSHFVHDVTFMAMLLVAGVAMLVQLYRPARRVAAMQVALAIGLLVAATTFLSSGFEPMVLVLDAPIVVAALLHPAREELVRSDAIAERTVRPTLLALVGLALVPVALYAAGQLNLQATVLDEHAELGHYSGMAAYALGIVTIGLVAAVGGTGRRAAAYAAGAMTVLLGAASLFEPTVSALDGTWSTLAILWGLALIAAFEWSVHTAAERREAAPVEESAVTR